MNKEISDVQYRQFADFLLNRTGIVLGNGKQYLVRSRLISLMHEYQSPDINTLIDDVLSFKHRKLSQDALEAMTTNETLWFRDTHPFDILREEIFPQLEKKQSSLNIWSAACSSGQEPYSIAMTALEYKRRRPNAFSGGIKITATDLSEAIIDGAKKGIYDALALKRGLPNTLRDNYFTQYDRTQWQINDDVKRMVNFKQLNLVSDFRHSQRFDIVFCRNVLIYFSHQQKTTVLQNISACMQTDAKLLLGASESLADAKDNFNMHKCAHGLYYSKA